MFLKVPWMIISVFICYSAEDKLTNFDHSKDSIAISWVEPTTNESRVKNANLYTIDDDPKFINKARSWYQYINIKSRMWTLSSNPVVLKLRDQAYDRSEQTLVWK